MEILSVRENLFREGKPGTCPGMIGPSDALGRARA
jgi:hypothetical protein